VTILPKGDKLEFSAALKAKGSSDHVQAKLFRAMVTTRAKTGPGLALYVLFHIRGD
jgi:hypothetical protein